MDQPKAVSEEAGVCVCVPNLRAAESELSFMALRAACVQGRPGVLEEDPRGAAGSNFIKCRPHCRSPNQMRL